MNANRKPIGIKSYGSIPHLPGSRLGPGDRKCHEGQKRIATEQIRDRHDQIIVQEKLDGSNVGVVRIKGNIYPLTRAGFLATTSPYSRHHRFADWVEANRDRFMDVLRDGERLCGEWLMQAHGTRYRLSHEHFVAFDLMTGTRRIAFDEMVERVAAGNFVTPKVIHRGSPISIEEALGRLDIFGYHGALDEVEGVVWRVERNELTYPGRSSERNWKVDFVVKYVRPDKVDGCYLPEISGNQPIFNWQIV